MKRKILVSLLIFAMLFTQNSAALATVLNEGQTEDKAMQTEEAVEDPAAEQPEAAGEPEEIPPEEEPKTASPEAEDPAPGDSTVQNTAQEAAPDPVEVTDPALAVDNPMAITQAPQDVDAEKGDTVTFTAGVQAEKPEAVSCQWQKTTEGGLTDTPQSTDTALQEKQAALQSLETGVALTGEGEKVLNEEEKQAWAKEIKNAPIEADNTGWQDIPGATGTSLTVQIDDEAATRATSYRMVAKTAGASLATPAAAVRSNSLFDGGRGTEGSPYLISNFDQLYNMRQNLNAHYRLTRDIDASGRGWSPVGYEEKESGTGYQPFRGSLDGNGFIVKNLEVKDSVPVVYDARPLRTDVHKGNAAAVGLFGYTDGAVIKNVGVQGVKASISKFKWWYNDVVVAVAGIAVAGKNTTIENCFVTGQLSGYAESDRSIGILLLGGITAPSLFYAYRMGDTQALPFDGCTIKNCYTSVSFGGTAKGYLGHQVKKGGIYPQSDLGLVERPLDFWQYEWVKDQRPVVMNSYYNTNTSGQSGGGTGMPQSAFTNGTVLNGLNSYVQSDTGLNKWAQDSNGFPNLVHMDPLNITVKDYNKTWNGNVQSPAITTDQPDARQGEDWRYVYTKDGRHVDNPAEVGTYTMRFETNPDGRRVYRVQSVNSIPAVNGLEVNTARFVINPKPDKTAPVISNLVYENTGDGSSYTPGQWADKDIRVSFDVTDPAAGNTRNIQCGNTTYAVDDSSTAVSGLDTIEVTGADGIAHTATAEGNNRYSYTIHVEEDQSFIGNLSVKARDKSGNEAKTNTKEIMISKCVVLLNTTVNLDGASTGIDIFTKEENYAFFAKNTADFKIIADTAAGASIKSLSWQFVPDGSEPDPAGWAVTNYTDQQTTHTLNVNKSGQFNGRLYVRGINSANKEKTESYHFMLDPNAPEITPLDSQTQAARYDEAGSEVAAVYEKGQVYSAVQLKMQLNDRKNAVLESGIQSVKAITSDDNTELSVSYDTPLENNDRLPGPAANTAAIQANKTGNYKVRIIVTDKAGNETTYTTEELHIDREAPILDVSWKKPADKTFGDWSAQNAELVLKNTNGQLNSKLTYYSQTRPAAADDSQWTAWQPLNEALLDKDAPLSTITQTQGDYVHRYKVVNEAGRTAVSEIKSVKVDTQTPDAVQVALENPDAPNSRGWINDKTQTVQFRLASTDVSPITATLDIYYKAADCAADSGAPLKSETLSCNQKGEVDEKSLALDKDGVYTVKARTRDAAGNQCGEDVYTYKVSSENPVITEIRHLEQSLIDPDTWGAQDFIAQNTEGPLGIKATEAVSGIEKIEYQYLDTSTGLDSATAVWQTYDAAKPEKLKNGFINGIAVRVTSKAGLVTEKRTRNLIVDTDAPEIGITPRQDITKWQQKVELDIKIEDVLAGITTDIDRIAIEGTNGDKFSLSNFDLDYSGTRVSGLQVEKDPKTGLYSHPITFTYTDDVQSQKANGGKSTLNITAKDSAGNTYTKTITYKIDKEKPIVGAAQPGTILTNKWYSIPAAFDLSNTGTNLSGIRYQYKTVAAGETEADQPWKDINTVYTTDPQGGMNFKYPDDVNASFYFRAITESGVISDNTSPIPVKVDRVVPETPEIQVADKPDGTNLDGSLNDWYKGIKPLITIAEPAWDSKTAPQTTYYKLYTEGSANTAVPATLGQSVLNSSYAGSGSTTAIQKDNNNGKDVLATTEKANSVTPSGGNGAKAYVPPVKKDVTISKKDIKILNIYPKAEGSKEGDRLRLWMKEVGSGLTYKSGPVSGKSLNTPAVYTKGDLTFNVYAVELKDFNNDPGLLKDGNGFKYDIVAVGMEDSNGHDEFANTDAVKNALREYMNAGNGFYIGHDSVFGDAHEQNHVMNEIFAPLAKIEEYAEPGTSWNSVIDNEAEILKEGYITSYPFDIKLETGGSNKFAIAETHSNFQQANGDIWVNFPNALIKDNRNFYLTTNGNVAMSQIGHTLASQDLGTGYIKGASITEIKLLVNTLVYLAQKPTSQLVSNEGKPQQVDAIIRTAEDFKKINDPSETAFKKTGVYVLGDNIDLGSFTGVSDFAGTLDGDGYTITGTPFASLTNTATIANVSVTGGSLVSGRNQGNILNCTADSKPLIGGDNTGMVTYSKVNGTVTAAGGIVAGSNTGIIQNCQVTGKVTSSAANVGGITAANNGTVKDCTYSGAVQGGTNAGGIAGINSGVLSGCKIENGSSVTGSSNAGGIAGVLAEGQSITDSTVEANVNVTGAANAGGIAGDGQGMLINVIYGGGSVSGQNAGGAVGVLGAKGVIRNVKTSGAINGTTAAGGLAASSAGNIESCLTDAVLTGSSGSVGGAIGINTGALINTSAKGAVPAASDTVGGFVGEHRSGAINGCSTSQNSFAGQNYEANGKGPQIIADGVYTLETWADDEAVDLAGKHNQSAVASKVFKVDTTAPEPFSVSVNDLSYSNSLTVAGNPIAAPTVYQNYDKTVKVTIKANDSLSGMAAIQYDLYEKATNTLKETKTVSGASVAAFSVSPGFAGYIVATAADKAGNSKCISTDGMTIDTDLPQVTATATAGGSAYDGNWTNQDVQIKLGFTKKNNTIIGNFSQYQVSTDENTWSTGGINNASSQNVATCTVSTTTSQPRYFKAAITGRSDGKNTTEAITVPVRVDKAAPTVNTPVLSVATVKNESNSEITVTQGGTAYKLYNEAPTVSLGASDADSGLKEIRYTETLSDTDKKLYAVPFKLADGKYKLTATANDNAGNTASASSDNFIVETARPDAPQITETGKLDDWTDAPVTLSVQNPADEPLSGVYELQYQRYKDGVLTQEWTEVPADGVVIDADGEYRIQFRTVSNARNISETVEKTVKLNAEKPTLEVQPAGTAAQEAADDVWTNQPVGFTLSTDGDSLYNHNDEYKTDGNAVNHYTVTAPAGKTEYVFTAKNKAGVASEPQTWKTAYDPAAPDAPAITMGGGAIDNDTWYAAKEDIQMTIPETESDPGKQSPRTLYYRFYKTEAEVTDYQAAADHKTAALVAADDLSDGAWMLEAYTADAAGNVSQTVRNVLHLSLTQPQMRIALENNPQPADTLDSGTPVYQNTVKAVITAADTLGIQGEMQYQLVKKGESLKPDGWKKYSSPVTISNFDGTIYAKAQNIAGVWSDDNAPASALRLLADSGSPRVSLKPQSPEGVRENSWTAGPVRFSLKPENEAEIISGIKTYEYSLDDGTTWQAANADKTFEVTQNGKREILARAVSRAGIAGDPARYQLWLDDAGNTDQPGSPDFAIKVEADYSDESQWIGSAAYTLSLDDGIQPPQSGVTYYYGMVKDPDAPEPEEWSALSGASLKADEATGTKGWKYFFKGITGSGLESPVVTKTAKIDIVSPAQPALQDMAGETEWRTTPLTADELAGAVRVAREDQPNLDKDEVERSAVNPALRVMKEDESIPVKDFDTPADTLPQLGTGVYELVGKTTDDAGNISDLTGIQTVKVDTDAPEIEAIRFERINTGAAARFFSRMTAGHFFNEEIKAEIQASDTGSGMDTIDYQVIDNESGEVQEENTVTADGSGKIRFTLPVDTDVYVKAVAKDVAGLESLEKISDGVMVEADKPQAVIDLEDTADIRGDNGWYIKPVPFMVQLSDADSGLKKAEVYVGASEDDRSNKVMEKSYSGEKTDALTDAALKVEKTGEDQVIAVVVTDQSGNQQTVYEHVNLEKGVTLTAVLSYLENAKADPDNPDAAVIPVEKPYMSGDITTYPVTASLMATDTETAGEPLSGISKIEYQTDKDQEWSVINDAAARKHRIDEEADTDYTFKVTTRAGNVFQTAPQHVVISRAMPPAPQLSITLNGSDVNGQWVNQMPVVAIGAGDCDDANIAARTEYYYETNYDGEKQDSLTGVMAPSSPGPQKRLVIPTADDGSADGIYHVQAWPRAIDGSYVDSAGQTSGEVCYDSTAPEGVSFGYTRESTVEGTKIYLLVSVLDNASGGKTVTYQYKNLDSQIITATEDCDESGQIRVDVSDIMVGERVYITKLGDNAENLRIIDDGSMSSEMIVPAQMPGADITFTTDSQPNTEGWYNADSVTVTVNAVIHGDKIYKPADSGFTDENGNPVALSDTNKIINLAYQDADGEYARDTETSISEDGLTASFQVTVDKDHQGSYTIPVTISDAWNNTSTASFTLKHDSIAPSAPAVSLKDSQGRELAESGITNQSVTLNITPDMADESDRTAPLKNWAYSLDGGVTWSDAQAVERLSVLLDSRSKVVNGQITARIVDAADNTGASSPEKTLKMADTTAPENLRLTEADGASVNGGWYTNTMPRKLKVWAEDPSEGVLSDGLKDWSYSLDGGKTWSASPEAWQDDGSNFIEVDKDGSYDITFKVCDHAGNESLLEKPETVNLDRQPPVLDTSNIQYTDIDLNPVQQLIHWLSFGNFYNSTLRVVIPAEDTVSGNQTYSYTIGGEKQTKVLKNNQLVLELPTGTKHSDVTYSAKDKAGNTTQSYTLGEETKETDDNRWTIESGGPEIGDLITEQAADEADWYHNDVRYTITIADPESGLAEVSFQEDGKDPVVYGPETFGSAMTESHRLESEIAAEGIHTIQVTARDNSGNSSERSYVVKIDQQSPALYPLSPENGATDVNTGTGLSIMADEPMQKGDGYITLYEAETGAVAAELHSSNNRVVIDGKMILISLPQPLKVNTSYYAVAGAGFVCDTNGNPSVEIGGKDAWQFKTKADDSKVTILGFKAEHIRRLPDSEEASELLAAVVDNQNPRSYNILTPADYVADDGKAYVKLVVTPLYNAAPKDIRIQAVNKDGQDVSGYVTQNTDGTFTILMPSTEEQTDITISIGKSTANQFKVVILNKSYDAQINARDIEAEVDQGELLNSIDLSEEMQNPNVTKVSIILNITREEAEALDADEIRLIEETVENLKTVVGGASAEILYLDINLLKQVVITTDEGEDLREESIRNLQNPITITVAIPEEIQGEYIYHVLRVHEGQTDVLVPEVSEDRMSLSFTTDRFSTYAITATAKPQTPEEPAVPETPDNPQEPDGAQNAEEQSQDQSISEEQTTTERSFRLIALGQEEQNSTDGADSEKPEATKKLTGDTEDSAQSKTDSRKTEQNEKAVQQHTCIVHYMLLALALILTFVFEWDLRRRKKKLEAEQQQDENGGEKDV